MLDPLGVPVQPSLSSETAARRIIPVEIGIINLPILEFRTQAVFAEPDEPTLLNKATAIQY